MQRTLSKISLGVFAAGILLMSARPAQADIIVLAGVDNTGTDNILFDTVSDVTQVIATDSTGEFDVIFTSDAGSDLLSAVASGQARILGGTGNSPTNNILFEVEAGAVFTKAVFNINSNLDGFVTLLVTGINLTGGTFSQLLVVDANGQNFHTVSAINNQFMTSIELTGQGDVTFEDLRQVRMGGFGDVPTTPVPEPASLLLFAGGLAASALKRRRS